jgi:hypothetical protein
MISPMVSPLAGLRGISSWASAAVALLLKVSGFAMQVIAGFFCREERRVP